MFEFELAQENRQLFKNEIKKNLVKKLKPYCEFTEIDRYLFSEGTHKQLYKKFGAHVVQNENGDLGTYFCVYAPHAKAVSVVGDFNNWNGTHHEMIGDHGIWSLYIPKLKSGETYKYDYVINSDSGIYADIIKGADADDPHRTANSIRSNKGNEGIINMKNSLSNRQFNGRSTKTQDFVYNEGYSKTLGNAKNDKSGIAFNGGGKYTVTAEDGTTFYDMQTASYSNQLIAVRQLKK